jgi:hypothetical protein
LDVIAYRFCAWETVGKLLQAAPFPFRHQQKNVSASGRQRLTGGESGVYEVSLRATLVQSLGRQARETDAKLGLQTG